MGQVCLRALHMSIVILPALLNDSFCTREMDTGPIIGHLSTEVQGHVPNTHIRVTCIDMCFDCMYMEQYRQGTHTSFDIHHGTRASLNTIFYTIILLINAHNAMWPSSGIKMSVNMATWLAETCGNSLSIYNNLLTHLDGCGGLVVSILATGTRVRGFKPGRSRWIFRASGKSSVCLPSEAK